MNDGILFPQRKISVRLRGRRNGRSLFRFLSETWVNTPGEKDLGRAGGRGRNFIPLEPQGPKFLLKIPPGIFGPPWVP